MPKKKVKLTAAEWEALRQVESAEHAGFTGILCDRLPFRAFRGLIRKGMIESDGYGIGSYKMTAAARAKLGIS